MKEWFAASMTKWRRSAEPDRRNAAAWSHNALVPVFVYCWSWLIFHFVCTALYLAPVGEFKARTFEFVRSYIEPRFDQRWSLFAPDPGGSTRQLSVACKVKQADTPAYETPLYDMTEQFYSTPWRTRLGPNFRLMRTYLATALIFEGESASFDVLEYQSKSDPEAAKALRPTLLRRRQARSQYTTRLAVRIASAECRNQFPSASVSEVHPVVDIVKPPTRLVSDPAPEAPVRLDFGWHASEDSVRFF